MSEPPRTSPSTGLLPVLGWLSSLRTQERWKLALTGLLGLAGLCLVVGGVAIVAAPGGTGPPSITPTDRGPIGAHADPTPSEAVQSFEPTPATRRNPIPSPPQATAQSPRPSASASAEGCGAAPNPWGYSFCRGKPVINPPPEFCAYFACVDNFTALTGRIVQCADGTFSRGQDSCSDHGGARRLLYRPSGA